MSLRFFLTITCRLTYMVKIPYGILKKHNTPNNLDTFHKTNTQHLVKLSTTTENMLIRKNN